MKLISQTTNTARTTIVVAGAQLLAALTGGVFALLVVVILGQSERADAFLAAYSAYLLLLLFGSTMRVALIPQFGTTDDPERFLETARRRVGEVIPVGLLLGLVFVSLAPVLGPLLMHGAGDDAKYTASVSFALLGIAGMCQIWSAILASVLGAARRFVASALFYLAASIAMVALASLLMHLYGPTGAALGVLASAALLLLAHIVYLWRLGFTAPLRIAPVISAHAWLATAKVSAAAVIPIVFQINLTVSIAFLSGEAGLVSAYVYAYLATVTIVGVTAAVVSTVTLPNLIAGLERDGSNVRVPYLTETAAFGTYAFVPVALGFACFGKPLADAVLGGSMTPEVLDFFWDAARIFLVMGLIWAVFAPLVSIALAEHRYRLMALAATFVVPLHVVLLLLVSRQNELAVAVAQSIAGSTVSLLLLLALFRGQSLKVLWAVVLATWPCLLLAAAFVVPAALLDITTLAESVAAITACAIAYFGVGTLVWPSAGRRIVVLLRGNPAT